MEPEGAGDKSSTTDFPWLTMWSRDGVQVSGKDKGEEY